ncbi:hypothetical protein Q2T76_06865 [Lactobacillus sp. YT155]|uniref:hypothetical protein n=1 Tax=Lactobacillus sp. YT155 TaxID=3060955 RepID=UPI00265EC1F2|nr:hypothetical protein [Lactobacillus sp. YT155]MDO1605778.1 hypothetical protein [Lactobacillus sp. YT155]
MTNLFIWIANAIFVTGAIFNIYWQSQITIRSRYKYTPIIVSGLFASWVVAGLSFSFGYIVLIALFLTIGIMDGVGGIGEKRLVNSGFFSSVYKYSQLAHITLIPVNLGEKNRVVAIFNLTTRQSVQMIFNNELNVIKQELEKHINDSTEIEIGSVQ